MPTNQCDGCVAGYPIDWKSNMHYIGNELHMVCTKERYADEIGINYKHWPENLVKAVDRWIAKAQADQHHDINDPYMDNPRFARETDSEEMVKYGEIKSKGCCGFFDTIIIVDGIAIHIGFNYGH